MTDTNYFGFLQSMDAFFPTGAFTQSFGVEDYVLTDCINDDKSLYDFITSFISLLPYQDLGLCSLAYDAYGDIDKIIHLDQIGYCIKDAYEIREASVKMNNRFNKVHLYMNDLDDFSKLYFSLSSEKKANGLHCISVGLIAASKHIPKEHALTLYIYNTCSSMINNSVKLVPLSQLSGQRILYDIKELMVAAVNKACNISVDEIGVSGCAYNIHCMNHERLYSRQYMS